MPWVRLDDSMPEHPKVAGLPDKLRLLWIDSLCFASKLRQNGHITSAQLRQFLKKSSANLRAKSTLVDAGLWDETEDGIAIHDWVQYNPEDKGAAARMRKYRARKALRNTTVTVTPPAPARVDPLPQPRREENSNLVPTDQDGSSSPQTDAAPPASEASSGGSHIAHLPSASPPNGMAGRHRPEIEPEPEPDYSGLSFEQIVDRLKSEGHPESLVEDLARSILRGRPKVVRKAAASRGRPDRVGPPPNELVGDFAREMATELGLEAAS